jgi:hypothetical protein
MIHNPIEPPVPTLDARWIISLWVAIHGTGAVPKAGGELVLEADTVRSAAAKAILALTSQLDARTGQAIALALREQSAPSEAQSDAQLEDALKRLGIRLYDPAKSGESALNGVSVAGFGKITWPVP